MRAPGKHVSQDTKYTTCPYCGVGCGVQMQCDTITKVNSDGEISHSETLLSELTGDGNHPANAGKLCVKGSHLLDTTDSSDKLLYPHVDGNRTSWDAALDKMAQQIQACLSKYGPESVAFYLSGQLLTEDYYVANKLMKGFIGSANVDTNSRLCMSSAVAAYKRAFGADAVPCCYEDLEHCDLLVLVGSNAAWTHPVLFQRMQQALATNPQRKMVVIDPRKTATSESADLHLAIKPGTDTWIYNGLLHYLIDNQLCDYAYIQQHTNDFETCSQGVTDYTLEAVAKATALSVELITQFYKMFASAHNAISFYSMGINQSSSGVDKANSIINCHLASGKIGKLGSGPFSITGQPNAMGGREVGGLANMLAAHMDIENAQHNALVEAFWSAPNMAQKNGLKAVDMFDDMLNGKIKFVWIMGTNPVVSMPNRLRVEAALKKCEMVVVSDIVSRNDTLAFADIALPASGWSEKDGTVTNSERCISRQRGIIPLQGECKHDWQAISDLAAKLGYAWAFNYKGPDQIFSEHAQLSGFENNGQRDFDISGLANLNVQQYNALRPIQWPINSANPSGTKRLFTDGKFFTANQKANFIHVKAIFPEQSTSSEYPFVLNTGRMRDQWHTMTRTGKAQALSAHQQQAEIHMHPQDAKNYNAGQAQQTGQASIKNGDLLALTSKHNKCQPVIAPVKITSDVKPGELFAPIHWSKSNTSHLGLASLFTSANDPISGQPELKHAAVSFKKVLPLESVVLAMRKTHILEHQILADYQVRINQGDFWLYHLATLNWTGTAKIDNTQAIGQLTLAQSITQKLATLSESNTMSWLSKNQTNSSLNTKLGFDEGRLCAQLIEIGADALSHSINILNAEFIRECLAAQILEPAQQHQLINAQAPAEYKQGKLICSCFEVRQKTIENAIQSGANTVEDLGKSLKCGTNCGSCKSELVSLIKQCSASTPYQSASPSPRNELHIDTDIPLEVIK